MIPQLRGDKDGNRIHARSSLVRNPVSPDRSLTLRSMADTQDTNTWTGPAVPASASSLLPRNAGTPVPVAHRPKAAPHDPSHGLSFDCRNTSQSHRLCRPPHL